MNAGISPETWDLKTLLANWHERLRSMIKEKRTELPFERLLFQAQADTLYSDTIANWSKMNGAEKKEAWKSLNELAEKGKDEMFPVCVRCGICCKGGSPTLAAEDLELVVSGQIPLESLMTIRRGEPVHSKTSGSAYFLPEEKIKLKEKPGEKICGFYDEAHNSCGLHPHKPAQCRAQACWDPTVAGEQAMAAAALNRATVLDGAAQLLELLQAHEDRASFSAFVGAFEQLDTVGEAAMSTILEMLAFDDHVREFAKERLSIPDAALTFLFGRSLAERVHLFGYRIEHRDDGTHILLPIPSRADAR